MGERRATDGKGKGGGGTTGNSRDAISGGELLQEEGEFAQRQGLTWVDWMREESALLIEALWEGMMLLCCFLFRQK
jgi:hypothetical protein